MSQSAASLSLAQVSDNTRSSVTIMKRGAKAKTSPDHTYRNQYSRNRRNFFPKDEQIDFSVNDVNFEKVEKNFEKKLSSKKEPNWSENDVNFTGFNPGKGRYTLQGMCAMRSRMGTREEHR